jgi:hypothetical protein
MKTFTHGMATQIWAGIMDENSDQEIIDELARVGAVVIAAALGQCREQ